MLLDKDWKQIPTCMCDRRQRAAREKAITEPVHVKICVTSDDPRSNYQTLVRRPTRARFDNNFIFVVLR
jgi:hypothetical protein